MPDFSFTLLLPFLQDDSAPTLLVADENLLHSASSLAHHPNLTVITNRYDVYAACEQQGVRVAFSDYDFHALPDGDFARILYRVSKEKPVVHHLINQASRLLQSGGELLLAGEKSDGIKTYAAKAGSLLGHKTPVQKHGRAYLAAISRGRQPQASELLDDRDYGRLRPIAELAGKPILSKPGVFGWDKIDAGSALLMDIAETWLAEQQLRPENLLDLGCGYGYLTLRSAGWPCLQLRVATDNNAAAVACMRRNAAAHALAVEVSADDCGSRLQSRFELILCNPPFHQGFAVDSGLTRKFLATTHRCLSPGGVALFVVNQFIAIEPKAAALFGRVEQLASDGKFKVLALHL